MSLARSNVTDILRRYAFRVRLVTDEITNHTFYYGPGLPPVNGQVTLAGWIDQTIRYVGTFRSTLRYPDTQRVHPVKGTHWRKRGKPIVGMTSLKGLPARSYCCSRCTERCNEDGDYREMLGSLNPRMVGTPNVRQEDGSRKTLAYTPHMKDEYDLRAYQAKLMTGEAWEKVMEEKLWMNLQSWGIRGNSGSWRCLVCGGTALDESLELDIITRLGKPKWEVNKKTGNWVFLPGTVWKFRVRVFGTRFLKVLKKRPEVAEAIKVTHSRIGKI